MVFPTFLYSFLLCFMDAKMKTHTSSDQLQTRNYRWYWAPHSYQETPGTSPRHNPYLQGDGGRCKCIPINPVSFFLQLIIFSTLHWDGPQLGRDNSMSRGTYNTRACTATFPTSLKISALSCRLPLGTPI